MTDATLTPEIYGDFGLYLEQIGVRRPKVQVPPAEAVEPERKDAESEDPNLWYKEGRECPF